MVERWVGTALSSFMSLLTITLAYLTGALCFAIYTCSKSLGGWLYISIKIANLTNYLICGYGVGLAMVGYWIGGDELMETLDEAKSGNFISNPYSWLVGVGAIMVFQSLLGLIGLCVSENCDGRCKWMVRFYNYTLWIDLLANVVILVMAVLLASELEGSSFFNEFVTDADFEAAHCRQNDTAVLAGVGPPEDAPCINAHAFEDPTAKCATMQGCYWVRDGKFYGRFCEQCVFTKEDLVELIRESWMVLLTIGLVIVGVLVIAVLATNYVANNIGDESEDDAL